MQHLWVQTEKAGLKDLLHAADLVPCVKVSDVEEVQQHLRHVFILVDDVLVNREQDKAFYFIILML